jgi:multiple sugar transport system permease protein
VDDEIWLGRLMLAPAILYIALLIGAPFLLALCYSLTDITITLVIQEFVYALTFITAVSHYTVSVGVPTFLVRGDVYFWGSLMAACFIASVPIAILYNFFLDRFITGFTVGAIK